MPRVDLLISNIRRELSVSGIRFSESVIRNVLDLTGIGLYAINEDLTRRLPILLRQFPQFTEEQIRKFAEADPSPSGAYLTWILRQFRDKKLQDEDVSKVREALEIFHRIKRVPSLKIERDINQYPSYSDLWRVVKEHMGAQTKGEEHREKLMNGMELVYDKSPWKVYKITSTEAAAAVGRHTGWCTKDPKWSKGYLEQGPLWAAFVRDAEKDTNGKLKTGPDGLPIYSGEYKPFAQLHFPSNQFMDVDDTEMQDKYKFALMKVLEPYSGVSLSKDTKLAYDYAEFKNGPFPEGEPAILRGDVSMIISYAEYYLKGRWPEGEKVLLQKGSPRDLLEYTLNVINKAGSGGKKLRWPEAEPRLHEDARIWQEYADMTGAKSPSRAPARPKRKPVTTQAPNVSPDQENDDDIETVP